MDSSLFSKLPAELRLCIYELTLAVANKNSRAIILPRCKEIDEENCFDFTVAKHGNDLHPLAITQTCRAIHGETSSLFYKVNMFRIQVPAESDCMETFNAFTDLIGPNAVTALRHVEIEMPDNTLGRIYCTAENCGCEDTRFELVQLREWSLQHPHIALWVCFVESDEQALVSIDVRHLSPPIVNDKAEFFRFDYKRLRKLHRRLEELQEKFRAVMIG